MQCRLKIGNESRLISQVFIVSLIVPCIDVAKSKVKLKKKKKKKKKNSTFTLYWDTFDICNKYFTSHEDTDSNALLCMIDKYEYYAAS